jgi:hypothetical protein
VVGNPALRLSEVRELLLRRGSKMGQIKLGLNHWQGDELLAGSVARSVLQAASSNYGHDGVDIMKYPLRKGQYSFL